MVTIRKRILSFSVCVLILFSTGTVFAGNFSDIADTDPLSGDIKTLQAGGFVSGYPDGTFRIEGTITRAEFVHIANGIFGYTEYGSVSNLFTDVTEADWYYKDVMIAQQAGYILGYPDGGFHPQSNITKEEVCAIFDRVLSLDLVVTEEQMSGVLIADEISSWAKNAVLRSVYLGFVELDVNGKLSAKQASNRGLVVYASARVLEKVAAAIVAPVEVIELGGGGAATTAELTEYQQRVKRTIESLDEIINDEVLPENKLKTGNIASQKAFLTQLRTNMQGYLDDPDNFNSASLYTTTRTAFLAMSDASQTETKRVVIANVDVIDLSKLRTFFGF